MLLVKSKISTKHGEKNKTLLHEVNYEIHTAKTHSSSQQMSYNRSAACLLPFLSNAQHGSNNLGRKNIIKM